MCRGRRDNRELYATARTDHRHPGYDYGLPQQYPISMFRFLFPTLIVFAASFAHAESAPPPKLTETWCNDLGGRLHSVDADKCRAQAFTAATERTKNGHALIWRDIPAHGKNTAKAPRALVIGGIHGDELTAVSIVFSWLGWIDEGEAGRYIWRVIPLANPDGLYAKPSTRVNANGVDLNRNFLTPDWASDARDYWVKRTGSDPRRFPGEAAASEIETRWLQKQLDEFKPDVIISIHAPYNLLDYDGPAPQPMRFGRLTLNRLGVYPGSLGNYGGLYKQVPVVTIELPNATTMPTSKERRAMWEDMLKWMGRNIRVADAAPAARAPEKPADKAGDTPANAAADKAPATKKETKASRKDKDDAGKKDKSKRKRKHKIDHKKLD